MNRKTSQYLRLGILVLAGILFLIFSIYLIGKQKNMFRPVVKINTYFTDVKGLELGNNVRFSGINVGIVSKIELINYTTVKVEMAIDRKVIKYIRSDAKVEISNDGLMGNHILIIHPGSEHVEPVADEGTLLTKTSITTEELLTEAKIILQNTKLITENLIVISNKMNNGQGDFSKLLNENDLSDNIDTISQRLLHLANEMDHITTKISKGKGDISQLINNDHLSKKANSILAKIDSVAVLGMKVADNLQATSLHLNEGKGLIQKLVYDSLMSDNLDTTLMKINESLDETKKAVKTVNDSWILNVFSKKKKEENKK